MLSKVGETLLDLVEDLSEIIFFSFLISYLIGDLSLTIFFVIAIGCCTSYFYFLPFWLKANFNLCFSSINYYFSYSSFSFSSKAFLNLIILGSFFNSGLFSNKFSKNSFG